MCIRDRSLSLGYYHENAEDASMDGPFGALLREFGELGVAVVTAAGNATTITPMYPAGFANKEANLAPGRVPLASVGASNPDGETVAYFSNDGDWVTTYRPGAALVSTFPTDITSAQQPAARVEYGGHVRSTIDPDDFRGGFCTWSGTSFAAPVLAGQIAAALAKDPDIAEPGQQAAVTRGRRAVFTTITEWTDRA